MFRSALLRPMSAWRGWPKSCSSVSLTLMMRGCLPRLVTAIPMGETLKMASSSRSRASRLRAMRSRSAERLLSSSERPSGQGPGSSPLATRRACRVMVARGRASHNASSGDSNRPNRAAPAVTAKTSSSLEAIAGLASPAGNRVTTNQFRASVRATAASKLRPSKRICPASDQREEASRNKGSLLTLTTPTRELSSLSASTSPLLSRSQTAASPAPLDVCNDRRMCSSGTSAINAPSPTRAPTATVTESLMLEMYFSLQTGITLSRMLVTCGTRE